MNSTLATTAITTALGDFGTQALVIIVAILGVAVGFFLIRWGMQKIKYLGEEREFDRAWASADKSNWYNDKEHFKSWYRNKYMD